jgi:UDP-glucose:(heptosyl)LPS alpha-1,3-glucosyltransferase
MKVCYTTASFLYGAGVGKFSVNLVKELSKRHDITLVTNNYQSKVGNIKVREYNAFKWPGWLRIESIANNGTHAVRKLDEIEKFDVIHGQGEQFHQDVLSIHGCHRSWIDEVRKEKGKLYTLASKLHFETKCVLDIEKRQFEHKRYKKIAAISFKIKNDLMKYFNVPEEDIEVIHVGLNFGDFCINNKEKKFIRKKIRAHHGIGMDKDLLLFVGQAFYKKGLGELVRALPFIADSKLLIVGNDNPAPFQNLARKLNVSSRVIFAGNVPKISDYYHASDAFVFPTKNEPFGVVITEAMAAGLPVITSADAGAAELIKDGRSGILINNSRNVLQIENKVNMLLSSRRLMRKISINGRRVAKTTDWKFTAKKFEKLYEQTMKC